MMFGARSTASRCTVGRPAAARGALLPAAATHVNAKATKRMQKRRPKKVRPRPRAPARAGPAAGGKLPVGATAGVGGLHGSPRPAPGVLRTAQCRPAPNPVGPRPPRRRPGRCRAAAPDDADDHGHGVTDARSSAQTRPSDKNRTPHEYPAPPPKPVEFVVMKKAD